MGTEVDNGCQTYKTQIRWLSFLAKNQELHQRVSQVSAYSSTTKTVSVSS